MLGVSSEVDNRFTSEIIAQVDMFMNDDSKGALTRVNGIVQVFIDAGLAYRRTLAVDEVMVHPQNRGGMGLNQWNVHRNLAIIKAIGADADHLKKALCLEVCPLGQAQKGIERFNDKLIEQSAGMLASRTGREKFASLACSHFVAGCRATKYGCKTSEASLADSNQCLNIPQVCAQDNVLKALIEDGWKWTILPWYVERLWPEFPDMAQGALNSEHMTFSMTTELQTMSSLSIFAQKAESGEVNWNDAIASAKACMPPCHSYVHVLSDFVRYYGGGDGSPMVRYLDAFAKEFGANKVLGETFLSSVVSAKFASTRSKFPFMRVACLATQLICPSAKIIDNVARLLTKSDVAVLTRKDKLQQVQAAEALLADTWADLESKLSNAELNERSKNKVFGRLSTRLILFITKKQKSCDGLENIEYKSFGEIKDKLKEELAEACGKSGSSMSSMTVGQPVPSEPTMHYPATMQDMSDPVFIAKEAGFDIGKVYTEKSSGKIFNLTEMGLGGCKFEEVSVISKQPEVKDSVAFESLSGSFTVYKGKMQCEIDVKSLYVHCHPLMQRDEARASAFSALMSLCKEHSQHECDHVNFYINPSEVRIKQGCKKGELRLCPVTEYNKLLASQGNSVFFASKAGSQSIFYIDAPQKPKVEAATQWRKDCMCAAFWWTKKIQEPSEVTFKVVKIESHGWIFPVLENTKAVKEGDSIVVLEAPPKKDAPPAKKQKAA